ncbi:APC family permease [Lacticaseibacillus saniviri]|uniref:Amino acid transporter n=1 Tax=Lacticaseibacillus saniviri JCM 17471 = DSM 24301 TaxID=1293598 RepID=A0A0R2N3V5_9LACO|nr:amino acid permease [Lacticaseibacillus saniviri]KRO17706.1 amino acid transporter [Lacticaseibacillus saniviri JCM 17471 = DSM 24301]MCG4281106.1 amino acid permease [Lacticaseibacillus saniviri]
MEQKQSHLKKEIGLFAAIATVMGTVIGGGVFFKVATVVAATQSASLTLLVWVLGGLLTLAAGLTVTELAAAIPVTGGAVKYIEYTYGKLPAFLLGWAQMIVYFPANIAALSIIFGTQWVALLHWSNSAILPVAIVAGASITGLNFLGARVGARVQSVSLIFKLIPIALIVIVGLLAPAHVNFAWTALTSTHQTSFLSALSAGLVATMFAYDGWLGVGAIAGEMKNPKRDLPLAIGGGLIAITLIYVLINLVFVRTLPISALSGNLNAAADAALRIFGDLGGKLVTIGILISVYGAINGYTMTGMRVPFAMAEEDALPFSHLFKRLSPHTSVPYFAGAVQFGIALIMMLLGSFDLLTDMLVFVMWGFSVLLFIAVFILRKREPELMRPYRVPGYPIIPAIALIGGIFILVVTLMTQPLLAIIGIVLTALGVPVYLYHAKHQRA